MLGKYETQDAASVYVLSKKKPLYPLPIALCPLWWTEIPQSETLVIYLEKIKDCEFLIDDVISKVPNVTSSFELLYKHYQSLSGFSKHHSHHWIHPIHSQDTAIILDTFSLPFHINHSSISTNSIFPMSFGFLTWLDTIIFEMKIYQVGLPAI